MQGLYDGVNLVDPFTKEISINSTEVEAIILNEDYMERKKRVVNFYGLKPKTKYFQFRILIGCSSKF